MLNVILMLVLKVRETIYILGLGVPGLRPPTEGEEKVHSVIFRENVILP